MFLCFPDPATLAAALRDGAVRPAVARRPVRGGRAADGSLWVESPEPVAGLAHGEPPAGLALGELHCWAELLPPTPAPAESPEVVLFHVSTADALLRLIGELRRLAVPGAGFVWYGRGDHAQYVVRVPHPPGHALHPRTGIVACAERAPGVWVQVGFDHPLCELIRPPRGRRYLIPGDGPWWDVPTRPFLPVDVRPAWPLAAHDRPLTSGALPTRFPVPARLRRVEATEPPTFWVMDTAGVERLHALVRDADGRLVDELDFAVAEAGAVVLRARLSRTGPPVLPVAATGFVPLLKLPNVYLPAGTRLRPPVRRDVLRDWLCRPDRVTWLSAGGRGEFAVASVPADAFRPLTEWVEYAVPAAMEQRAWRPVTTLFVLEPFTAPTEVKIAVDRLRGAKPADKAGTRAAAAPVNVVKGVAPPRAAEPPPTETTTAEMEAVPAAEAVRRLQEMEERFLAMEGPLDAAERVALWPRMADLAATVGHEEDAAICWANALWAADDAAAAGRWARAEAGLTANADRALGVSEPRLAELRALAVWVIAAAARTRPDPEVAGRLPAVGRVLEQHGHRLPVRVVWLAWVALARLSGGDVLALTRARDRILRDLLETGLRTDRDLPAFLRGGPTNRSGGRAADIPLLRLRERARDWCRRAENATMLRIFLDLTFAYALARFGDATAARRLMDEVGHPDDRASHHPHPQTVEPYQRWLWEAYRERVRRLLDGEPPAAPLSPELRKKLDGLHRQHGKAPGPEQRQGADRFLQFSRILEPFDRVDPYRQSRPKDDLGTALAEIAAFSVPARNREKAAELIELRLRELFKKTTYPPATLRVLGVAVPVSVRFGESFALECVGKVSPALAKAGRWRDLTDLTDRVTLLETAVGVAAHFGRSNLIGGLLDSLRALLAEVRGELAAWLVAALGGGSFRFLSRLGQAPAAQDLLDRMTAAVTDGKEVPALLRTPALNRAVVIPALLRLAGGWFYFGDDRPARQALADARAELFEGSMSPEPRNRLAESYAMALGHAPADVALAGFAEIFERLPVVSFEPHGTIHRLRVIEAVALATAAEEFAADARSRRWLDEDEYLVRRRIHRDVETALGAAGLG